MKKRKAKKKTIHNRLDGLWRKVVRAKWGNRCFVPQCRKRSNLHCHHIITRKNKTTRWDVNNGVPLCYRHHYYLAHSDYEAFRKILVARIGEKAIEELSRKGARLFTDADYDPIERELKCLNVHLNHAPSSGVGNTRRKAHIAISTNQDDGPDANRPLTWDMILNGAR